MFQLTKSNSNPDEQGDTEMEIKREIVDFKIETTSTSISNVATETENDIRQRNTQNKSPVMLLQNEVNKNPNLKLDVETMIKTEFPDFEIETTATSIQYVAKETNEYSLEKYIDADETKINILTHGSTLNKSPVMSMLSTENGNTNFEVTVEGEQIKTEITDFEIESTPTTNQYVAKETEKLSTEEQLNEFENRSEKYLKRPYECETCFIGFFSQKNYDEHLLCHTVSRANGPACSMCDVAFATEQGFILHCRITHDELKPITEELITSVEGLKDSEGPLEGPPQEDTHNSIKRSEGEQANIEQSNKCNICDKRFKQFRNLEIHKRLHTRHKPYECNSCDKSFTDLSNLKRHERVHTGHKPYECNTCDKTFMDLSNLKRHERVHTGHKPYECNTCDKRFTVLSYLKCHERVHTGHKPYECNTCDKRFTVLSNLKRHERVHTGDKPYECNTCNKRFTHSDELKRHERVHTGHRPYECNTCNKRFMQMGYLKRHEKVHTGVKPYECNICGKRFRRRNFIKIHELLHTGDKPYECNICNKKFTQSGHLKHHKRVHTGDKPYECNTCDKRFTQMGDLKRHERVHTGDKPYECNICDKKFSYSGYLKNHERVHSGEKPYECNTCNKRFTVMSSLKRHERMHTGRRP